MFHHYDCFAAHFGHRHSPSTPQCNPSCSLITNCEYMRETTEENDAEQAEHFQNALFLLPIDVLSGEDCRFLE